MSVLFLLPRLNCYVFLDSEEGLFVSVSFLLLSPSSFFFPSEADELRYSKQATFLVVTFHELERKYFYHNKLCIIQPYSS